MCLCEGGGSDYHVRVIEIGRTHTIVCLGPWYLYAGVYNIFGRNTTTCPSLTRDDTVSVYNNS
jgi:hypothetical protein